MKIIIPLCMVVFLSFGTLAQEAAPAPTVHEFGWKNGLVSGLTMTQVAFTDWAQGGESALSYTISAAGRSVDEESTANWTTIYKFAFGQTRLGNEGLRKADDMIDIGSVLTYKLNSYVNPYVSATLKSQFAVGYTYNSQGIGTPVSQFFDPGYLMQTAGAGFQPIREIKTRLGLGLREIITNQFNQYTTDNEKVSVDGGFESVIEANWHLDENDLFTTQLSLFEPFKTMGVVVVRDNSSLTARVSKYITTILNVQLINEKHVDPRTQVKETLALGLSYTLF